MNLTPEVVKAYRDILVNPEKHGSPFKSIDDIFDPSSTAIPKHIVFKEYIKIIDRDVPKVIFYIIMDGIFAQRIADDGNLGYLLKFNSH